MYELYYDVWLGGQYVFKIQEWHKKYVRPLPSPLFLAKKKKGPIIRISPYELHVETPQFYEELYAGASKKRNKYDWAAKWAATPDGSIGTVGHDLHRMRHGALNPFFSKRSVRRLQPLIQERVDMLLSRIKEFGTSGEPLTISLAYVAFSSGKKCVLILLFDLFLSCICRRRSTVFNRPILFSPRETRF